LNVKFELIYTFGTQNAVDFSPTRWSVITSVLKVLEKCLTKDLGELLQKFPDGLQIHQAEPGGFPRFQLLQTQAGDSLLAKVLEAIFKEGLPGVTGFPVQYLEPDAKRLLFEYVSKVDQPPPINPPELADLLSAEYVQLILLLLKGLFAHGVLPFVFQHKRWRVNYGLDLSRSMLAVPYQHKDLPTLRSEYSHPDVTILLTCLSYYHEGLSDEQLFLCFGELLASDDPEGEYGSWTSMKALIPSAFHELSGINLKDRAQCTNVVFPLIRHSMDVIDFYMSRLVFPKEMKEFPQKLSSSGWDISRAKYHPLTGFSGTNDSRYLLPLSVTQADIPSQVHTNATVLDCLLQEHNSYSVIPNPGDSTALLNLVVAAKPEVRVILDAGALILEWRNSEMARKWLERVQSSTVEAVVYFDDQDELVVLTRDGRVQSLQESPMLKQMDKCLVYLDQGHVRGTDLKLPLNYRAATTLGLGLTKDQLVQGKSARSYLI
jgi:hypothetical protein